MLNSIDHFYLQKEEPVKSCLLALRDIILMQDNHITAVWKYGMPFFCYREKMFCYLWVHKKRPLRILIAKVGLDGYDRGAKVIATSLRDAGMEVIYTGLLRSMVRVSRTIFNPLLWREKFIYIFST